MRPASPSGEADALIGCDLIVAAGDECLSKLNASSRAVISADLTPTARLRPQSELERRRDALIERLMSALGDKALVLDAQRLAKDLFGDAIASNMFMLGAAWQRGLVPLRRAAIERAIELNGVAIEANKQAFEWGRRAAYDPAIVERLAGPERAAAAAGADARRADRAAREPSRESRGEADASTLSRARRARARWRSETRAWARR